MSRIERHKAVNHHRDVQKAKPRPKPKAVALAAKEKNSGATTKRADTRNYADQQKTRLNANLAEKEKRSPGALIGGTAGSTAGQFASREAQVRGAGNIRVKNTELSYDYANQKFVKNPNPNTSDFVSKVRANLNELAPGTRVVGKPNDPIGGFIWDTRHGAETAAIVKPAPVNERVAQHDAGYRLIDQLKNNPNEIAIHKYPTTDNAFAAPRNQSNSLGTVTNPGKGSAVDVSYNPDAVIALPARDVNGKFVNSPVGAAPILGHEFNHASHMQRGTNDPVAGFGNKNNVFALDGKNYIEADHPNITLREEGRTVGFENFSYKKEPTENLLRRELGVTERRISYQDQGSHQQVSSARASVERAANRLEMTSNTVIDGVRGSRNSALIGGGFAAAVGIAQGKDAKGVATDAAIGAGTGVGQEVVERLVNGPRAATSGMTTTSAQAARATLKGAAVAGAVINTGFAVHDQWNNLQNDATRSKAVGVIAGEAAVGAASGATGAYAGAMAGAAIGSIVPGVGTVIGGVVGFAAGAAAGYLADKGLRELGVNHLVASGVTATYNGVANAAHEVSQGAKNLVGGAVHNLASIFD